MINTTNPSGTTGQPQIPNVTDDIAEEIERQDHPRGGGPLVDALFKKIHARVYEGSAEKVWAPEHGVRTTEAITQMLGPYGQLLNGSPLAIRKGLFAHNVMGSFQSGINHGSVQVMRDQVARRGLGLPSSRSSRSAKKAGEK